MLTDRQSADLELLAAFIDGRLSGEQKAQVEERLLHDEDYYEIFLETARFQQEQDAVEQVGVAPWWRSWRVAVPIAAAALLVFMLNLVTADGGLSLPSDWVASLNSAEIVAREGWDDPGWSRLRSDNITKGLYGPEEVAFRLGVRALDLRVALAANDRNAARTFAALLEQLADAADLSYVSPAYKALHKQLEIRSIESDALVAQAAEIEQSLFESFEDSSVEAHRLNLGAWSEAGRLAALSHDGGALARVFRDFPGKSVDSIATEIKTLEAIFELPDPGEEEFDNAVVAFRGIVINLAG